MSRDSVGACWCGRWADDVVQLPISPSKDFFFAASDYRSRGWMGKAFLLLLRPYKSSLKHRVLRQARTCSAFSEFSIKSSRESRRLISISYYLDGGVSG